MNRRSIGQIAAAVILLLAVAFLLGRPGADGPPLDPESVGELGTLGLVEFLEQSGATVQRGIPTDDDVDVALVLTDRLNGGSREQLLDWIQAGGHAVVTDTTSPLLATGLRGTSSGESLDRGTCEIEELADVTELSGAALAILLPVPQSRVCFGSDAGAYVVQFPDGDGQVTGLGGAVPFVNRQLDKADNSVLAGRLLLDADEPTISVIYSAVPQGVGQQSPLSLIGTNVRWYGVQLLVVTFIGLLWALRRFGKVVREPEVVELPGSLSVRATSELHRRSNTPDRSLETIRRALYAKVRSEYRLPAEVDRQLAATTIAEHSSISIDDAMVITHGSSSGSEPLDQAKELDRVGRSVLVDEPLPISPDTEQEEPNYV